MPPHQRPAQLALAEELDLLHEQAFLDFHELWRAEIDPAAVVGPDIIYTPLLK